MIKKIILAIILFCCIAITVTAQFTITITNSDIPGNDPHTSYEGELKHYDVTITLNPGQQLPNKRQFVATVTNGSITQQYLIPTFPPAQITPLYIDVRWNCNVTAGTITITETNSGSTGTYNNTVFSFTNDLIYCRTASPAKQNLLWGDTPQYLDVVNCSPYCHSINSITYMYKWEVGDVPVGVFPQVPPNGFTAIPGFAANYPAYNPPVYNTNCIKAYRRKTTFIHPVSGNSVDVYSSIAVISTFAPLSAGTLSGGAPFNNGIPTITQTPASGGLCDGFNYFYTWEMSLDNSNWNAVATGISYPTTVQIPGACYIRRKVDCGGQSLYTNVLNILPPPLNPGTIVSAGGNITFNTVPVFTQTPASGGACSTPDFIYTWERSINNGPWLPFGTGVDYPPTAGIIGNCKIRRKVHCVYEDAYSNEINFITSFTSPNTENLNYVRTNDIVVPYVHTWEQADAMQTGYKLQSTTYFDGFGRTIQSVVKQGSLKQSTAPLDPNNITNYQDLVSHISYDGLGRADKGYLPYATSTNLGFFKTNAATEQQSFTNLKYGEPINSIYTYSQTTYDGSPLNRAINAKLPGAALNNDPSYLGISSDYDFNKLTDNIRIWEIGYNTVDVPTSPGAYPDNTLTKSITKDEKNKLIVQYIDLSGNTILKRVQEANVVTDNSYTGWLNTYYVYDDFGRLRYTITPKAVANMVGSWNVDTDTKKGLCFYQEYDKRGRISVKHSPDGGEVWLVYDNRDRLVFSQDENQRNRTNGSPSKPNQWSFSLYDENDRPLATGLINDIRNRTQMQDFVDGLTPANQSVEIYTGLWETITAYNTVAGKISGSGSYYCQPCTASYTNSVSYYDDYLKRPLTQKQLTFNQSDFTPTTNANVEQPVVSFSRIRGAATVSKIRVLDDKYDNGIITDERFLISTSYYDDKGRVIQSHVDNIKGGVDVSAVQYDFSGKVLSTRGKHNMPGNAFNDLLVLTKTDYDLLGRGTTLWKLYTKSSADISNLNKYKKLSELAVDEFGRAKTKKIGDNPSAPGSPMEIQDFTYNIQGWLTGMNKDYALAAGSSNDQWAKRFGYYLGYENGDGKFTDKQYNGSITGAIWRSQGDNALRKYDYVYDNINRFKAANFTQKDNPTTANWSASQVDLSTSISSYDANGNIKGMIQKGIVPGTNGGVIIDNLQYNYYTNGNDKSNKLQSVTDYADAAYSGKQGDFKDYGSTTDYDYDLNGNLKYDKNKNIIDAASNQTDPNPNAGIISNFLDLPQTITIKDKSKTEYTYDAAGNKLSKKITQLTVGAPPPVTTWYLGGFVYEEKSNVSDLQYILNEEGKLRIMENQSGIPIGGAGAILVSITGNVDFSLGSKWGAWDYYIKDNLSNTRMVLTEEQHLQIMKCKMDAPPPATPLQLEEEREFGNTAPNNEVINTRVDKNNTPWTSNSTTHVSKLLNLGNTSVGPNAMLKVMAGDNITASVKYFYQLNGAAQNTGIINNIVNSLLGVLGGSGYTGAGIKDNISTTIPTLATGNIYSFISDHQTGNPNNTVPHAYLNIIFFDEQFRYVPECSGAKMVDPITSGNSIASAFPLQTIASKNGYVYIYLSNETQNIAVYFDDLQINYTRGPIVEDNAYYPFGLKIQGISAKAAGKPKARQGYQGDYNEQDEETGYNEFALRFYDPQIGRWLQIDPYNEFTSGYIGMGDNPINFVDPDGGSVFDPPVKTLTEVIVIGIAKKTPTITNIMLATPKLISIGKVVGRVYNVYNSSDGKNSFMLPASNLSIEPPLIKMDGSTLYVHSGEYRTTGVEYRDEINPNYIDLQKEASKNEFFSRFEYKTVGGGCGGPIFQRNGFGHTRIIPGSDGPLGDEIVGQLFGAYALGGGLGIFRGGAARGITQVEQYALRAAEDGFYPVMKRGFANPQELTWLNKGDVWKFGTTKNPLTRYSQSFLDNTGNGLRYTTEFSGTLRQATSLERMKILNFRGQNGFLPSGNKIVR